MKAGIYYNIPTVTVTIDMGVNIPSLPNGFNVCAFRVQITQFVVFDMKLGMRCNIPSVTVLIGMGSSIPG